MYVFLSKDKITGNFKLTKHFKSCDCFIVERDLLNYLLAINGACASCYKSEVKNIGGWNPLEIAKDLVKIFSGPKA